MDNVVTVDQVESLSHLNDKEFQLVDILSHSMN